jgi:hypothetical protein
MSAKVPVECHVLDLGRFATVIAMVEAGEGTGIVPSFALPVCQRWHVGIAG